MLSLRNTTFHLHQKVCVIASTQSFILLHSGIAVLTFLCATDNEFGYFALVVILVLPLPAGDKRERERQTKREISDK